MTNICYLEISVHNPERAQKFYNELFGWKFEKTPAPMDYWVVDMKDCKDNCSTKPIKIGMMNKMEGYPGMVNYINTTNIDESMKKVTELGGKVQGEKLPVKGMGWFATCQDTEGNTFALWQNDTNT